MFHNYFLKAKIHFSIRKATSTRISTHVVRQQRRFKISLKHHSLTSFEEGCNLVLKVSGSKLRCEIVQFIFFYVQLLNQNIAQVDLTTSISQKLESRKCVKPRIPAFTTYLTPKIQQSAVFLLNPIHILRQRYFLSL